MNYRLPLFRRLLSLLMLSSFCAAGIVAAAEAVPSAAEIPAAAAAAAAVWAAVPAAAPTRLVEILIAEDRRHVL